MVVVVVEETAEEEDADDIGVSVFFKYQSMPWIHLSIAYDPVLKLWW